MHKRKAYPSWICHPCGMTWGIWYSRGEYVGPPNMCSTMHLDTCGICDQENVVVTEPRDYGHLKKNWDIEFLTDTKGEN